MAGNADKVIGLIPDIYNDDKIKTKAESDLKSADVAQYGKRILTMAEKKGKDGLLYY